VPRLQTTQEHVSEIRGVHTKALEVLQNPLIGEVVRNSALQGNNPAAQTAPGAALIVLS
jgi:hypothetical protein